MGRMILPTPLPQRPRPLLGLWLTARSGGVLLWRAARVVVAVARQAPSTSSGARWLLVPGFRLRQDDLGRQFAVRIERAYALWQEDHSRGFVLSGGAVRANALCEADAALEHLIDLGLPHGAEVRMERASRTTAENLEHSRDLLDGGASVVVVSNRYHLARIGWLARQRGLDWQLCAAEPRWSWRPLTALAVLREAAVLVAIAGADAGRLEPARLLQAGPSPR